MIVEAHVICTHLKDNVRKDNWCIHLVSLVLVVVLDGGVGVPWSGALAVGCWMWAFGMFPKMIPRPKLKR